jgi:type IV pilus assembly protein PilB
MVISDQELLKLIEESEVADKNDLAKAVEFSQKENISLYDSILKKDLLSDAQLDQLIADKLGVPFILLSEVSIPNEVLNLVPEVVSRKQKIIAFKKDKSGLHVAMRDPKDIGLIELLKKKNGLPIVVYFSTAQEISNAAAQYSKDLIEKFDDIIKENLTKTEGHKITEENDLPIIKIVETILSYAYQNKASDIHIEPHDEYSIVRFRIDGILHDIINLPIKIHEHIIVRIKVLSKLRIDEHQSAQDGKMQFKTSDEDLDIRVSLVPTTKGEKVVMRLLSSRSRQFSLESLGFDNEDLKNVQKAYKKPYGMILSTGPTGSGKTTTMYAILKLINERGINISTIEDPVEYDIGGITQIQVNPKTNLTFAAGLRSILRQDPNVILVGEIRDDETASIAVNASMTGHLVLSTIHANDTATSFPRLFEMGIEPFLVASTINVIIAQRLVRKIHTTCRVSEEISAVELAKYFGKEAVAKVFGKQKNIRIYKGKGCKADHDTGYDGRIGIFEVMVMDESIRKAIVARADASEIKKIAVKDGMRTMLEDGLQKIRDGYTTIEEVLRVTKE